MHLGLVTLAVALEAEGALARAALIVFALRSLDDLGPESVWIPLQNRLNRLLPDRVLELKRAPPEQRVSGGHKGNLRLSLSLLLFLSFRV